MRAVAVKEFDVTLCGVDLPAIRDNKGRDAVLIGVICDLLGLDYRWYLTDLRASGWATVWKVDAPNEIREICAQWCLSIQCLPMWLIQIPPNRVWPEYGTMLTRLRGEAVGALYNDAIIQCNLDELLRAERLDSTA